MKITSLTSSNERNITQELLNFNNSVPITKRVFDFILAAIACIAALPLVGISALLIKIYSPGPVFFAHERVGYRGKRIKVLKLRTMHTNAQELLEQHLVNNPDAKAEWETHFKLRNDPRIIPIVGKFLRKTSLDELPQLWNILKGEMSIVGPRPFPIYHLNAFSPQFCQLRQQVMPGLTGLWQVSSRSDGDLVIQEQLDRQYIEQRSFWLDMKIIAKTFYVVLAQKGAC